MSDELNDSNSENTLRRSQSERISDKDATSEVNSTDDKPVQAENRSDCSLSSVAGCEKETLEFIPPKNLESGTNDADTTGFSYGEELGLKKYHDSLEYFSQNGHDFENPDYPKTATNFDDSRCTAYLRAENAEDYVDIDFVISIEEKDIHELMDKLRTVHYNVASNAEDTIYAKCKGLFERDYECKFVDNFKGNLSNNYPVRLIVPVASKASEATCEGEESMEFDTRRYVQRVENCLSSRLLTRFVAPVILFDRKFICRAGTLTVRKSAVFENARKKQAPRTENVEESDILRKARNFASYVRHASKCGGNAAVQLFVPSSIRKLRKADAQIIRDLKVQYICDLMIEDRKMFKQTIRIGSSEKINQDVYCDYNIEQMPYPGCELFPLYHSADRNAEGLVFDWNMSDVKTKLKFTEDPHKTFPDIDWENYKTWDTVELTKNYMKILLSFLAKGDGGLLVHCVVGWDRTPLFISMLRTSLWADGVIHTSLDYRDMAYLTLAYDWFLFGHDLPQRLKKKEEILHFCFKFLPYISTDEFSVSRLFDLRPSEEKRGRAFPEFIAGRRQVLNMLSSYVLKAYDDFIIQKHE